MAPKWVRSDSFSSHCAKPTSWPASTSTCVSGSRPGSFTSPEGNSHRKGVFPRSTSDRTKPSRSVRMQQGRVQVDADWNKQADVTNPRIETEALDVVGGSGGPLH